MICPNELVKIGKFNKLHGVEGEISFSFTKNLFDENECLFFVCELDGIFVPFKVEEYRLISASLAFVKLKNICSESQARVLVNKEVYFPKKYLKESDSEEIFSWNCFIGFTIADKSNGEIGIVSDVDTSTLNILFIIETGIKKIFIPASGNIIVSIDEKQKRIFVDLPEGLLNL